MPQKGTLGLSDSKMLKSSEETFKSDSSWEKMDESLRPSIRISKLDDENRLRSSSSNLNKKTRCGSKLRQSQAHSRGDKNSKNERYSHQTAVVQDDKATD